MVIKKELKQNLYFNNMENKEFTLKRYDSVDEVVLAAWKEEDDTMTMEDLKSSSMGGLDGNENEVEFSYNDQKEGIEKQGYWGWIDRDKLIHFWIGKELSMEELIHFFAHEIGHRTDKPYKDGFKEEMRAEGYGRTATLAYEFAKKIKDLK